LSKADLREAKLKGADLNKADLSKAYLEEFKLNNSDLNGANLSGADLRKARLWGANLRGAIMPKPSGLKDLIPKNPEQYESRNIVFTTILLNVKSHPDRRKRAMKIHSQYSSVQRM